MADKRAILIVDDEASIREFLEIMLKREGFDVVSVDNAATALKELTKREFAVLITDISMPEMNGIDLLGRVKQINHETQVIIMTAFGSTESAVEAMKLGAADYLTKPFQIDEMKLAIQSAIKSTELERENRQLRSELGKSYSLDSIIGNSPVMHSVYELVRRISQTRTNIMILGESGTGKELVAHAIHRLSSEQNAPFVVINCAAVPEGLFESELFGHKKGSFTGAVQDKKGIFEQADKGTLFLDEVGDIPLATQVKLLRAIQQKTFRPVGGTEDVQVETRIICATNKDLEALVKAGSFREDLFYRLNVIQVHMPALRERREDIPLLAEHFLRRFSLSMGKHVTGISKEAMQVLEQYSFPGNVRELENLVERAVALENASLILPETLPQKLLLHTPSPPSPAVQASARNGSPGPIFDLEKGVEEFERVHILRALDQAGGVKTKAASLLGISFRSFRYRLDKYGIADPNPEESE